jgi:hypothetical protein
MKKRQTFYFICGMSITAIFLIALGFIYRSNIPQAVIKNIVQTELVKAFKQEVTVESISGNLFNQAIVKNVRFHNNNDFRKGIILEIGELEIKFSLIKTIRNKMDILAGSKEINAKNVRLNIIRNKQDQWNVFLLVPPAPTTLPAPPITFKGKVNASNLFISFEDQKGWGEDIISEPFKESFYVNTGKLDFADLSKVKLYFNSEEKDSQPHLKASGNIRSFDGKYDINFYMSNINTAKWGPYVFPFKEFAVTKNNFAVQGQIKTKVPYPTDELPFWFKLKLFFNNNSFKIPVFPKPLDEIYGELVFKHGNFSKQEIQKKLKLKTSKDNSLIWQDLIDANILDEEGWLLKRLDKNPKEIKVFLSSKKTYFLANLKKLLKKQPTDIAFKSIQANFYDIPINIKGDMSVDNAHLKLLVSTRTFESTKLKQVFPAMKKWKFSGPATSSLIIKGNVQDLIVNGVLDSPSLNVYAFNPRNLKLHFSFHKGFLKLDQNSGELYKGNIKTRSEININANPAIVRVHFSGESLKIKEVFPPIEEYISGNFNVDCFVNGNTDLYTFSSVLESKNLDLWEQNLFNASIMTQVTNNIDININEAQLFLNNSNNPINIKGHIFDLMDCGLEYSGNSVSLNNIFSNKRLNSSASTTITGVLETKLSPVFWKKPYKEIVCSTDIMVKNIYLYDQLFSTVKIDTDFFKNDVRLKNFILKTKDGYLKAKGFLQDFQPTFLVLETDNFDIGENKFIQNRLSPQIKPFSGKATIYANIRKNLLVSTSNTFLSNYSIVGLAKIKDAKFKGQEIDSYFINGNWNGNKLSFSDANIFNNNSQVFYSGTISTAKKYDFEFKKGTLVDFADFLIIREVFGTVYGQTKFNGSLNGIGFKPNFNFNIDGKNLRTNALSIDSAFGNVSYDNGLLSFDPINLTQASDKYYFMGHLDFSKYLKKREFRFEDLDFRLNLALNSVDLSLFADFMESIYKEIKYRRKEVLPMFKKNKTSPFGPEIHYQIDDPNFIKSPIILYSLQDKTNSLDFYNNVSDQQLNLVAPEEFGLRKLFSGKLTCQLQAESRANKPPNINTNLVVYDAEIMALKANELNFNLNSEKKQTSWGGNIRGGDFGGKEFSNINMSGTIDNEGSLLINKTDVAIGGRQNQDVLSGSIPLSSIWTDEKMRKMNLNIKLYGDGADVLSIFNPYIAELKNEGKIVFDIIGTLESPVINAKEITLKNAKIMLNELTLFKSPIQIQDEKISIENNKIALSNINLLWQGIDTKQRHSNNKRKNEFLLNGTIDIINTSFLSPKNIDLLMDLSMANTLITLNFPKLYNGDVKIEDLKVKGIYSVPLTTKAKSKIADTLGTESEKGPQIKANIALSSGEIVLPTLEKKKWKPTFGLDVNCYIKNDITIGGSLFGQGVGSIFNMFDLSLAESKEPLHLLGTLNAPNIKNEVEFFEGTINLFNKSFDLLRLEEQRIIFREEPARVKENTLSFTRENIGDSNRLRIVPIFNTSAMTVIENIISTSNTSDGRKDPYSYVVVNINGPIYSLSNIQIDEYGGKSPQPESDIKLCNSYNFSDDDNDDGDSGRETEGVIRLLMPELLISSDDDNNVDQGKNQQTMKLISELGETQLNTLFRRTLLRPTERKIAKMFGLYDLKVDYNLGSLLMRNLTETTGYSGTSRSDENNLGLNMITKLLTNQLFLRVRTDLELTSEGRDVLDTFQISEIELTYYIWQQLSLNYGNYREEERIKARASLKYTYEF